MGQAFNRLGTKVYIVDRGDQILGKEDKDMADGVMNVMRSEGVVFHLKSSIEAVKDLGRQKEVIIKDAKDKIRIKTFWGEVWKDIKREIR